MCIRDSNGSKLQYSFDFGSSDWTVECWVNFDSVSSQQGLICMGTQANAGWRLLAYHNTGGFTSGRDVSSGTNDYSLTETGNSGVAGQWTHVAQVRNGSTITMYVDGVQVAQNTGVSGDFDSGSDSTQITIGAQYANSGTREEYLNGKLEQIRISTTARYTSAFTPPTTPFTTDANTKLLIQSDFSEGGLGADHSNNYNYFTPTNLTADDMMLDSPMNNFATLNPLVKQYSAGTFQEGNLKTTTTADAQWAVTIPVKSGKWYLEFCPGTSNGCLLYTSPSPRDGLLSRMPSSA